MLLPREHLPLSCLDLAAPHADLPPSRNFESRIRILELEGRLGSNILIAWLHSSETLYAIEREENGLYVLCKLGSWIRIEQLSQLATAVCRHRMRVHTSHATSAVASELPLITPHLHKENKRKRLAIEELQSLVRKRPRSQSVVATAPEQRSCPSQCPNPVEDAVKPCTTEKSGKGDVSVSEAHPGDQHLPRTNPGSASQDVLAEQPTADDIFHNIRSQYFETLYHSLVWNSPPLRLS